MSHFLLSKLVLLLLFLFISPRSSATTLLEEIRLIHISPEPLPLLQAQYIVFAGMLKLRMALP